MHCISGSLIAMSWMIPLYHAVVVYSLHETFSGS